MTVPVGTLLTVLTMAALIGLSFFFSVTETALLACNRHRMRHMAEQGRWQARLVLELLEKPEHLLSVVQISDKVVDAAFAALMTYWMVRHFGERGEVVLYATGLIALTTLLLGEVIPKTLGAYHPDRMALWFGPLLYLWMLALYPAVRLTGSLARLGLSWLGHRRPGPERSDGLSEEEVRSLLLTLSRSHRRLSGPFRLIWRILDLPRHPVDEIMIPRHRVQLLAVGMPIEQIAATLHTSAFSRFPVYQDRLDNIVGVLYAKDFWGAFFRGRLQRPEDVMALLRPPLVVTSGARIDSVLREMQKRRVHIAVVFDEYGRFEGIVTLEDIIEEIVGEIEDEFDARRARWEPPVQRRGDDVWEAVGSVSVKELNEILPEPLPESPEYATLAGFLIARQQRIPEQGEVVEYPPYRFEILDRQGPRLQKVRIVRQRASGWVG